MKMLEMPYSRRFQDDGDTTSLNIIYTDESIKEIDKFLESPTAYTTPTGSIAYSQNSDVVDLVMKSLTE